MSDTVQRGHVRSGVIGFLLALMLAVGALQLDQGYDDIVTVLHDREADSLTKVALESERRARASQAEQRRLSGVADSLSTVARVALAAVKPRNWTVSTGTLAASSPLSVSPKQNPDPETAARADTTEYVNVQRPVDQAPHRAPKFLMDELLAIDGRLLIVATAWEGERAARIHADSVAIPDIKRQLFDSDSRLRNAYLRIEDRDKTIARQGRELAIRRRLGLKEGVVIGAGAATLLFLSAR